MFIPRNQELIEKWDCEGTTLYLDPPYEGVEQEYYKVNEDDGFDHQKMLKLFGSGPP